MEKDQQTVPTSGDPSKANDRQSAEDIVDEMIKKASLEEASSDEEYISAEEEDDEVENYEVLRNVTETDDDQGEEKEQTGSDEIDEENGEDTKNEEEEKAAELKKRELEEESLTEEEKEDRREQGQKLKDNGNVVFRNGNYDEAISEYTKALDICPLIYHKERAIMFANRAACKMKMEVFEDAIADSTSAVDLHPQYMKAVLRRAELYEKTEKLDEALQDYEAVLKLDPAHNMSKFACARLQEQIKERNEKLKTEMMGKLKDLGNMVLRPFGLSTNNFKLQQDPDTGSYSMQFQQNTPGNGS